MAMLSKKEYMKKWHAEHPDYQKSPERRQSARKYVESEKGQITRDRYRKSMRGRYSLCKGYAKRSGIDFTITLEEFKQFWEKPCHYCNTTGVFIGLDRIDSSRGYSNDNVLPCCYNCNVAKAELSYKDFIAMCHKIASLHPNG